MAYTGTLVTVGTGSMLGVSTTLTGSITYTPVGEPSADMGLKMKALFEDATNQQSTGKERIAVFPDYPSFPLECNMVESDAGQLILQAAILAGTELSFQWTLSKAKIYTTTGDVWTFKGFVETMDMSTPVDKKKSIKFNLTVTGAPAVVRGT